MASKTHTYSSLEMLWAYISWVATKAYGAYGWKDHIGKTPRT